MKKEVNNFDQLSKVYSQFTDENKEKLVKTAKRLLKLQKQDLAIVSSEEDSRPFIKKLTKTKKAAK
jgi:Zn-dependent M16 (insulinase) family peptidase